MDKGITILDAFKSLEDIDDEVVKEEVKKVSKPKVLKEGADNKSKNIKKITLDISGNNMYDRGQAYYYARTGDFVDFNGKRYEVAEDETHRIGYGDTILLKDADGNIIEVSKKDFIDGAMLLKEAVDNYWVLSDGKNPKNSSVFATIDDLDKFIADLEANATGDYWELLHFVNGKDTKVWSTKDGKIGESCELKEEPVLDLSPEYDSRKSFYGKARVDVKPDGTQVLYSYGTPVCRIKDGKATLLRKGYLGWASSQTTLRHVKEFLKQNGFEAGSVHELAKKYPIEQAGYNEELTEEVKVNIADKDAAAEAKEILEDSEDNVVEKIVDIDANTIEELKDSYIGNAIIRCPACKTLIYKKPELLEKDSESDVYNVGETCPHCGSTDGFELVGQVASLEVATDDKAPTTGKDSLEVTKEETEEDKIDEVNDALEDKETEEEKVEIKKPEVVGQESLKTNLSSLDSLDETTFNSAVSQYLTSLNESVESFTMTNCKFEDEKLVVEGTIKNKDNTESTTTFTLSECVETKGGKLKLIGSNGAISESAKAFTFVGTKVNDEFICESLSYKYLTLNESKKVLGRIRVK